LLLACLLASPAAIGAGAPGACRADSPERRIALLELYTSEGCSSCPPADAWLRGLARAGFDADQVVPLALHVDYWNYLGWTDPFSSPQFTRRQHALAAQNRARTVYTPGVFLNGREWRGWHRNELSARVATLAAERPAASIHLDASTSGDTLRLRGQVRWKPGADRRAALFLVVMENNLVTEVGAGENTGRQLRHDHVVRYLSAALPMDHEASSFEHAVALHASWKRADLAIAAFLEDNTSGEILQAVAPPRCQFQISGRADGARNKKPAAPSRAGGLG
jgi:hypothetical protein